VGTWLSKVKSTLSGEAEVTAHVRRELQAMQRSRSRLVLEIVSPATTQREALATVVEQVRDQDIIISQPSAGAHTLPLAAGERVMLHFPVSGGVNAGEARVLGRIKLPSGGKRMFFGYRLTIPTRFQTIERRLHPRYMFDKAIAPHVRLVPTTNDSSEPAPALSGVLVDISLGGAQVKIEGDAPAVKLGTKLVVSAELPKPVGAIEHPVTVMRTEHDSIANMTRVGLQFDVAVPNLPQLLALLQSLNARRGTA
jgi:c-di-GMP-binding flagellar brake protein YcgR